MSDDHEMSSEQSNEHEMSPTLDQDGIRRSKRKKFQLDFVAAAHGENQKKSRRGYADSGSESEEEEEENDEEPERVEVARGGATDDGDVKEELEEEDGTEEATPSEEDELGRGHRKRRSTAEVLHGYRQDLQELEIPNGGDHCCDKCPISYNNKSSLANHMKMHNGGTLRFACELCDFSASTIKSLNNHSVIHRKFGVLSPQISPAPAGPSTSTSTSSRSGAKSRASGASSESSGSKRKKRGLNTSVESSSAPQLAVAEPKTEEAPALQSEEESEADGDDDGPPVLEREVPESPEPQELGVRKSGRALKPTPKVLEKKTRGPYKKKNKQQPLTVDSDATSSESGQNSPILSGSLPTSSSSSVTPPPASGSQQKRKKTQPSTPPASRETSEEKEGPKKVTKKRGRVKCEHCPYHCSSPSRLQRHMQGHLLREGYICPVDGCHFMCRKQGFIAKHYILHGKKLPSAPKYCRKTLKAGKWLIEECEDPMMVSLNLNGDQEEEEEDDEMEDTTMMDSTTDSTADSGESAADVTMKEAEPEEEPVKKTLEKVSKGQKRKLEVTPKKKTALSPKKMLASPKKKTPSPQKSIERPPVGQDEIRALAQIRTHKSVKIDGFDYKQCNVGGCEFRTSTVAQIMAHKIHTHGAMDSFPLHQYLCFTCGHRSSSELQLRWHKFHTHNVNTRRRYQRLFYLKEIVGDKFYIRYFTVKKPLFAVPAAQEAPTPTKQEAPPTLVAEVTVAPEPMIVKQEIVDEMGEERKREEEEDDEDRPFDPSAQVLCCNSCPFKTNDTARIGSHHAKHFVDNDFKCAKCSWSCDSESLMASHDRMHQNAEREQREKEAGCSSMPKIKAEPIEPEVEERIEPEDEVQEEDPPPKLDAEQPVAEDDEKKPSSLTMELQGWCLAEKAKRPELEEPFTRKMIDSVKGFQCSDCPYTSKYRGDMRSHKKRHDIEQSFRCVQCTYTTNRPVSLKDHLKQHAIMNRALMAQTEEAPSTSNTRITLSHKIITRDGVHLGTRYGLGKDRIYTCARCPFVTVVLSCLWRHYRHHRDKPRVNVCSNCTYSSLDSKKMDEHMLIHLSLGAHLNESHPFVKRVDYQGRPVSSLMDLGTKTEEKRTPAKRKLEKTLVEEVEEDPMEESEDEEEAKQPKRNQRVQRIKEEDKEFRPSNSSNSAPKRRKMSTELSPEPEASTSSQPTRQLSERASRNRVNYSLLSRNGSGKPTPSSSSANLEGMIATEVQEQENELARLADEPDEISHWRIRSVLNKEFGANQPTKCPDCPYKTSDPEVLEKHRYYHTQKANGPRPYVCSDCSFNTYTPTALLQHLKLHSDGFVIDPMMKHQRLQKHQKKGDVIPPGAEGLYCRNCPYKTANRRAFNEHVAYHRHLLINRMQVSLKRQPPKEEYQRPKLKHQFVARNAKYCKKCTFKCVSHSSFIEHLDRHGWDQLYKCHICDYSDNNKSVVSFHQLTHHIVRDQTLHGIHQASKFRLENGKILKPETAKIPPTPEEFVIKSRGLIKCSFCDYFCHVSSELAFHMTVNHLNEPNAEETISHLSMGLIPPQATVTTV